MSSQNLASPDSISSVDGETGQSVNTPYKVTDSNGPGLSDTIDHPKFANPGSNDNNLISDAETTSKLLDSIQNYLNSSKKNWSDIALVIIPISIYNGKIGPAIFMEDHLQGVDKHYVRCFRDFAEFNKVFLDRKFDFNNSRYESEMLGFYQNVVDVEKITMHNYIEWPFHNVPIYKTPRIIVKTF
jgi:hypothetical protein